MATHNDVGNPTSILTEHVFSLDWKGYVVLTIVGCFIIFWASILFQYVKWRTSPLNQIPGPKLSFVVGGFREIRREPFMAPHKRWCQELGYDNLQLMHYTTLFGRQSLLVLDKDIVRTILTTQPPNNSSPRKKESSASTSSKTSKTKTRFHKGTLEFLRARIGDGLVTLEGDDWKRHRRILQPSFHTDFLKDSLNEVVPPVAERFVSCWKQSLKNHDENRPPREIDVASHLAALTLDVVGKVLFSHEFNGLQAIEEWANSSSNDKVADDMGVSDSDSKIAELQDPFLRALSDSMKPSLLSIILIAIRLDFLDGIINLRTRRMSRTLDNAADQVIAYALQTDSRGTMRSKSLLHLMLQDPALEKDGPSGQRRNLSRDEIRNETKTFLMAGHETTSTWLYWAFYALAKHPDVQDRLYEDIVKHTDSAASTTPISLMQISNMDYLQAILQEVLRLYPPVGFITRFNSFPEELGGYEIPVGTRLVLPIHILHRHPHYWDDPETFRPERWLNVSEAEQERRRFAFLPFSAGGRNCIGYRFATLEAQLILASVVRAFKILIAPSQRETNHTYTTFITMKAKPPLKVVVQNR